MSSHRLYSILIHRILLLCLLLWTLSSGAQKASITETSMAFTTYPFSDPNPVPEISRIYPYYYFHGYTNTPVQKEWNMVILENEFIKVYICPDIGGKVWGAIEKSTGKEFLYFNHVVKFRDVAMRGAWTSGGLEYNFGDIGHIPTCATPVDYAMAENPDGSVTCTVGAIDLPSGTRWNVEIRVSPGKAYFETKASWFNNTGLPCTYYHWMNAAAKASGDLEFIYPGNTWIGHGGESGSWPVQNSRNLAWYKNNDFGSYKSYHVINAYSDYFGGYWHDEGFGFGRTGNYDEKPGKKLWIWGLSQQGMIWENILTDTDGQYIEYQAGKLFNQAAGSSSMTPFKHKEFAPHDADIMREKWFPIKGTGGMVAASPFGVLNVEQGENKTTITLSALQALDDTLRVSINGKLKLSERVVIQPLELFTAEVAAAESDDINIVLGDYKLAYSSAKEDVLLDRPISPNADFDWESAYGLYTKGLEFEKQRAYADAEQEYRKALDLEPGFLPALNRMALSCYRKMDYPTALEYIRRSLAIDTYNGEANYLLGMIEHETGDLTASKSGFSVAMGDIAYRSAAATELASIFLLEKNWRKAKQYAQKALNYNTHNLDALQTQAIAQRKTGDQVEAAATLGHITTLDATSPFSRFETFLLSGSAADKDLFIEGITNEFPHETFLDLAIQYVKKGCTPEAVQVLEMAPTRSLVNLWLASLDHDKSDVYLDACLEAPCDFVFPHRTETAGVINALLPDRPHWKLHYYLGLILWNKGLITEAKVQFATCGDEPDFAPFYLAMENLADSPEEQLQHLQTAITLAPKDWRAALALSDFYRSTSQFEKALSTIQPFINQYPEQSSVGLAYARSLMALKRYEESVSFLENYEVLPFEGATAGRDLYKEACVRSALQALEDGNYDSSIEYASKAKDYPLNLGVGRPYGVDERLEDYILSRAYGLKGDEKNASRFASKVMEHNQPHGQQENSKLYLQLKLLMENGQQEKAEALIDQNTNEYPENLYVQWAAAKLANSLETAMIEARILGDDEMAGPYETRYVDGSFGLVLEVLGTL